MKATKEHNVRIVEHDDGSFELGYITTLGKREKSGYRIWRRGNRRNMIRLLKRGKIIES